MTFVPASNSFTPLATIHTSARHVLHPSACNPVMDLVVLLTPPGSDADPDAPSSVKGKERARNAAGPTAVALWRMSGSKVWEVDVDGSIIGLAWSIDGLHLTLLTVADFETHQATLRHVSVHDGRLEQTVPIPELSASTAEWDDMAAGRQWWTLTWLSASRPWPEHQPGSALHIIDSLPRVTPVEPPKPAHILPFMMSKVAVDPATIGPHSKLASFPSLLPAKPPLPPDVLRLRSPCSSSSTTFLTGSLRTGSRVSTSSTLNLAQMSNRLASLFDFVLKGIEAAEHAFREGEKQTLIWREEVESCGEQQGMTKGEVHADLFRLLSTGRHGPAVGDWLGNRLTGRTIAKWEQSATAAFKTIGKIISESVIPATEGVVLLLEELSGWARFQAPDRPPIDRQATENMIELSTGLLRLLEHMRQDAEREMISAAEFMKWLKYEITRTTSHDPSTDALPAAAFDVKIVWAFLSSGFVSSTFKRYFPPGATKLSDQLPPEATRRTAEVVRPLDDVIRNTLKQISSPSSASATHRNEYASPPVQPEDSFTSSHMLSSPDATPHKNPLSRASSPDSLDPEEEAEKENEQPGVRIIEEEPWIWATNLISRCEAMLKSAFEAVAPAQGGPGGSLTNPGGLNIVASRQVNETTWYAMIPSDRTALWLVRSVSPQDQHAIAFTLSTAEQRAECVAVDFFDDVELAVILETGPAEQRQLYLTTMEYAELGDTMSYLPEGRDLADLASLALISSQLPALPLARCRPLKDTSTGLQSAGIALNGRKGRRVGCVSLGDGKTVEVLDMEENEDDDDEGEEGEEQSMEGS